MRIISKFHDYYDSAMGYGIDKSLVYLRQSDTFYPEGGFENRKDLTIHEVKEKIKPLMDLIKKIPVSIKIVRDSVAKHSDFYIFPILIGFCGKVFPCFRDNHGDIHYDLETLINKLTDTELEDEYIKREEVKKVLLSKKRIKDSEHAIFLGGKWESNFNLGSWKAIQQECSNLRFDEIFVEFNVPIFSLFCNNCHYCVYLFELNPNLSSLGFQKIKNPFECFQEISMYLGNQLVKQIDPAGSIDDETLRDEKGFNEWSFRKHRDDPKKVTI